MLLKHITSYEMLWATAFQKQRHVPRILHTNNMYSSHTQISLIKESRHYKTSKHKKTITTTKDSTLQTISPCDAPPIQKARWSPASGYRWWPWAGWMACMRTCTWALVTGTWTAAGVRPVAVAAWTMSTGTVGAKSMTVRPASWWGAWQRARPWMGSAPCQAAWCRSTAWPRSTAARRPALYTVLPWRAENTTLFTGQYWMWISHTDF